MKIWSMGIRGTSFRTRRTRTMRIVRSACADEVGRSVRGLGYGGALAAAAAAAVRVRRRGAGVARRTLSWRLSTETMRRMMSTMERQLMRTSKRCMGFPRNPQKPFPICVR